jgi:site-specific DNA-methyltransferase (adenine-specific)
MKEYLKITNECNMELMSRYLDNHFDLAIVDPPYGIARFGNRGELSNRLCKSAKLNEWDIKPSPEYFKELFRVSKNQIVWGANNFTLPESEYFLIWDKHQTVDNFASAEYAWTNCKKPAKVFRYSIHKTMADRKSEGGKIHPTQKPAALYQWLLTNYAEPNFKILDTHLGSGSIAIAVDSVNKIEKMNLTLTACELDTEYYQTATQRIEEQTTWNSLF